MGISEKLPSRLELIPEFVKALMKKIEPFLAQKEDSFNMKLCIEEALANAVRHGNKLNPDLFVEVNIDVDADRVIIKVKDQGQGFDFKNVPNPTEDANIQKPCGRGVFLIKNFMDEVDFFDDGRGIKMVKILNKDKGGGQ
ncbi:MAG: ATP-binding protein [Candidatus Gorgyraea atricola]|nr:ATP-binding protein [Candidatus Gorgyraea atricola]